MTDHPEEPHRMTSTEYTQLLGDLLAANRMVWTIYLLPHTDAELEQARRICEQADAVGFIVDPTRYRDAMYDGRLEHQRRLLKLAQHIRSELRALYPEDAKMLDAALNAQPKETPCTPSSPQ